MHFQCLCTAGVKSLKIALRPITAALMWVLYHCQRCVQGGKFRNTRLILLPEAQQRNQCYGRIKKPNAEASELMITCFRESTNVSDVWVQTSETCRSYIRCLLEQTTLLYTDAFLSYIYAYLFSLLEVKIIRNNSVTYFPELHSLFLPPKQNFAKGKSNCRCTLCKWSRLPNGCINVVSMVAMFFAKQTGPSLLFFF